jgi:hypothetical protein
MRKSGFTGESRNESRTALPSGAINFDPVVTVVDPAMAQIVWLDAYITNVDRTFRNTNMLIWHKNYGLSITGQVYIFITLGLIGKSMPKVLLP